MYMALLASAVSVAEVVKDGMEQKAAEEFEVDPKRLIARQKQIEYGKATLGYKLYLAAVPREQRKKFGKAMHPRTPDVTQKSSKRAWDGMVRAWRRSLHKYDPVESSAANASTADAVRDLLLVTSTPEPTSPDSPVSTPPDVSNAMISDRHCATSDNPSPKDAPPSSRTTSFRFNKDQARSSKTAHKRVPLRDSTNGQDSGMQQWIPKCAGLVRTIPEASKPANTTAGKGRSDQSSKSAGHSFPVPHRTSSGCSPAEPGIGAVTYRSSKSSLIRGPGASARAAASGDLPSPPDTAFQTPVSRQDKLSQADPRGSSMRPAAMARPYQPPHQRHAGRSFNQLIAQSVPAPDQCVSSIGTDKLPAHIGMMIQRRNEAYAAAAAVASGMAVATARSTAKSTVSCSGKCLVCKEAESTVLLLPCRHWSLCCGCSHQYLLAVGCCSVGAACTSLGQCPACLKHVKQHVSTI